MIDFLQLQMMTLTLETGFTKSSISRLESRFKSLDRDNKGYLEKKDLMCISEVSIYKLHLKWAFINDVTKF